MSGSPSTARWRTKVSSPAVVKTLNPLDMRVCGEIDMEPLRSSSGVLDVDVFFDISRTVVVVSGEVDMATAPALRAVLEAQPMDGSVPLDVAGVKFCASAGLTEFVRAH